MIASPKNQQDVPAVMSLRTPDKRMIFKSADFSAVEAR
jgi:hypothetical protein